MTEKNISNFDIKQIADSGQCFRMRPVSGMPTTPQCPEYGIEACKTCGCETGSYAYTVISRGRGLLISQDQDRFTFSCPDGDMEYWEQYFDLSTDYKAIIDAIDPKDRYLTNAARYGSGIRILRQDPWEMIITFIISQQKTIPAIQKLVESLCSRYGTPIEPAPPEASPTAFYSFPTPEQLNEAALEDLLDLKLGYRAKYIKRICEDACSGALDLNRLASMEYSAAMEYLQGFYGIGEKVANCICLFGLHHIEAFPVDTWIRKILLSEYAPGCRSIKSVPQTRVCETLVKKYFSRYKGCAGVMQQYIFFYARSRET